MLHTVEYTSEQTQSGEQLVVSGGPQFPEKIETNRNMLRLYLHPICPFAERSRLAFAAKEIQYQTIFVDMSIKPEWFVKEGGVVPVLESTDGDFVSESDVVVQFALDHSDEGAQLLPQSPFEAAKIRRYIKKRDEGFIFASFKATIWGKQEDIDTLGKRLQELEEDLSQNTEGNSYLLNQNEIGLADIILSPVLVRFYFALHGSFDTLKDFSLETYPNIVKYVENILEHPALKDSYVTKWQYVNQIKNKQADNSINLAYPIDVTPLDLSQSKQDIIIPNGLTAKPLRNSNYVRLYGHPMCPFVQRTLLTLSAKEVEFQFVGIDLTTKNRWHYDINKGLVPMLEHPDGTLIHDSLDICDWIEEKYPGQGIQLYPDGETSKPSAKETIQLWFQKVVPFILVYANQEARNKGPAVILEALEWAEQNFPDDESKPFIQGTTRETMVDLMILPFFRDLFALEHTALKEDFFDKIDFSAFPKVTNWYKSLYSKYTEQLGDDRAFTSYFQKTIEANGPKVQLFYPLF
ncbi:unnamed protein product [Moneuplotes crassus]|uniref:Glutathione S-transferase n=1 Tax=Euplotes crassus TaxID=5936 RepID=A0AAD1X9J0_EUPCR|nr:unnamed protein product [Moneuplotes crassus]